MAGESFTDLEQGKDEQVVTPWEVRASEGGRINYSKVVEEFGCSLMTQRLIDRVESATGTRAHHMLRRGIFFAHRDLDKLLDAYEQDPTSVYLYTGRGPSSEALHMGHLIPFMFTKWLQDAFQVPLVIQLTDDEKYLWRGLSMEEASRLARENAKDILALGFDPKLTFVFKDTDYMGGNFYKNCVRFARNVTFSHARNTFGFTNDSNIGQIGFPPVQAAPCFPDSFPHLFGNDKRGFRCLIPCAIDQDPYFRLTRDVCPKMKAHKPSLIESTFFPGLKGESSKMSASDENNAVYVTDSPKAIKKKVNKYAFSGGMDSAEEQRKHGADLSRDIPWKWLNFMLDDDDELERIGELYASGQMLSGEVKSRLVEVLQAIVGNHQARKAELTEEEVDHFFSTQPRSFPYTNSA